MEKILTGIITALGIPVLLLNLLSGIVGGIWLMATGQWSLFIGGLVYMFFGATIIGILVLPQLLIALPVAHFSEKENYLLVGLFRLLSIAYLYTLIAVSTYVVSDLVLHSFSSQSTPLWASLLWLYALVVAPWQYMASKERDNESTTATTFVIAFSAFVLILCIGLFGMSLGQAFPIVVVMLLVPMLIQLFILVAATISGHNESIGNGYSEIIEIETDNDDKRSWKDFE